MAVVEAAALRCCAVKVNGATLPKVNGRYTVFDNEGRAVPVWVKRNLFDLIPRLKLEGQVVCLARSLTGYEYF